MFLSSCGLVFACPFATNIKLSPGAVALGKSAAITYDTAQDGSDGYYQIHGQNPTGGGETLTSTVTDMSNNQQVGGPVNGRTILVNAPGIYKVTTTVTVNSRKDGHTDQHVDKSASNILKVYQVDLVPLANAPLAPGRICLNAQDDYWTVPWKISIVPHNDGTKASVIKISGDVEPDESMHLVDGAIFNVVSGLTPGDYKLRITHDTVTDCTATKGDLTFEFEMKNLGIGHGDVTRQTSGDTSWGTRCRTFDPYRFSSKARLKMALTVLPENAPSGSANLEQLVEWKYGLITQPPGVFPDGKVQCATKITTQTTIGELGVQGVIAVHTPVGDIGASVADIFYNDSIGISGLYVGDTTKTRSVTCSSATGILVGGLQVNHASCLGSTEWDNSEATYNVDGIVSVKSLIQMKGTRSGGVPLGSSGAGSGGEIGFVPTYGTAFKILNINH